MEKQVLTAEQMQELIELGIDTSNASMCWAKCAKINSNKEWESYWHLELNKEIHGTKVPTFTLQDILEMLPESITTDCGVFKQVNFSLQLHYGLLEYSTPKLGLHTEIVSKSLLQAAFNMFKWVKENKYI